MKRNLIALVLVAIVCALAAQWLRQGGQSKDWTALRVDMVDALERLWNTRGHKVELLPGDKGVAVSAQVVLPADVSPRQQQWNFPLLRYVAQRNGPPPLQGLSIHLLNTQQELPEGGIPGEQAKGAVYHPYAEDHSLENHLELVRRQAQAWLDTTLGAGNALALVDGEMLRFPSQVEPGTEQHFLRAREEAEGKRANSVEAPAPFRTEYRTLLVLVANGRAEGVQAGLARLPELEQSLHLKLDGRDSRRVVLLP